MDAMDFLIKTEEAQPLEWKAGNPCYDAGYKLVCAIQQFGDFAEIKGYEETASHYSFDFELYPGVKPSKMKGMQDTFDYLMGCKVKIESKKPGLITVTVPIINRKPVLLGNFRTSSECNSPKCYTAFALGDDIMVDLAKCPHLLIAGSSGSGKSVTINSIIMTMLVRNSNPEKVRFIMIDPKQVELSVYNGIPQMLYPVATTIDDAIDKLQCAVNIMRNRYDKYMAAGVRDIEGFEAIGRYDPRVVVVIDELADLMIRAKKQIEPLLVLLAQEGRAAGIHLVVATQEPTVNVITGLIKANMPCRIALKTSTSKESVVILGHKGAEDLFGKGDMIYKPSDGSDEMRLQGVYVSTEEVQKVCDFFRAYEVPKPQQSYANWREKPSYRKWGVFAKFMKN